MYYKDLEVWKEAIKLTTEIYTITKTFPDDEKYGLVSQMRRAVVAIPSNIAEGSSRKSDTAFSMSEISNTLNSFLIVFIL